ncbi:2-(3-amino-3-carboxypropyl)histidine synthase subunit 1 [Halyomorpha halys]|uniref:2-(3-amino-3-carboxypropyl)histidine synthase subunit 1 n=1 Tax=Halyomorpha halys TaxID=286706 RepID=UPI0006D50755|nr:2-(3-amino-3-carboxypropyl)histidine synthase subunit 1 [Halyomorpha halys]
MCDIKRSEQEQAVVVRANPSRKVFRPQSKTLNKIPDDILNNVLLNAAIQKLPQNYNFEIHKTIWRIRHTEAKRVALQMPEGLLLFSTMICDIIEQFTSADTVIMGDVTYGACCVDDFTAKALRVDLLIHYGHSCLIPVDQMPDIKVLYIFVDIKIDPIHFIETIKLNFKMETKLAFVSTIQFITTLHAAAGELRKLGYDVKIPQSRPLSPGEVLGCTAPTIREVDALVYLGDGRFHLEAAMIANPNLKAFKYDPYEKKFTEEDYDYDEMHSRREKAIQGAQVAGSFGIIFGTLGRQGNKKVFNYLQNQLKIIGKPWVNILLSEITPKVLRLMKIGAYIQTSCPRLSIDWGAQFPVPLLTPYEGAVALGKQQLFTLQYPMDYYAVDSLGPWTPNSKECCGTGCAKS